MGLSSDEQRRLDRLAADLAQEDPRLARRLSADPSSGAPRARSRRWATIALTAFVGVLAVGALLRVPPVCVAGWIGILLSGLTLVYASGLFG